MNIVKEILEILHGQTAESIEEFRQEWIENLADDRFKDFNIRVVNNICDNAMRKATA